MSLTLGTGPFAQDRGAYDSAVPATVALVEDWPRRMRAVWHGETVLDSRSGKLVHRPGKLASVAYPLADIRADLLVETQAGHTWDLKVGDDTAAGAVTTVDGVSGDAAEALGEYVELDYAAMDRWFEEDDPIYAHPRDPYHRVDVLSSSRHVTVRHDGEVIAETHRPKLLFETSLPVRYYIPFADVRIDRLTLSDTVSECPYKGDGQYWHLVGDGARVDDVGWSLPHPLPEGFPAAEHICFDVSKVDVTADGDAVTS